MRKILYSAVAFVLLAGAILASAPSFRAVAQSTVLNYFAQPTSSANDNVLTIGGTQTVASGGVVNFASGATLKFGGSAANVTANVVALDGSNPTSVQTGFTAITSCTANLKATAAPGLSTSVVTVSFSTGQLDIYAWKPTSNASPNLTASTGTENVAWSCIGG